MFKTISVSEDWTKKLLHHPLLFPGFCASSMARGLKLSTVPEKKTVPESAVAPRAPPTFTSTFILFIPGGAEI